jgi:hypothetical protein
MEVVGLDERWPNGVVFPVKEVRKDEKAIFPIQTYDWDDVEARVSPLVKAIIEKIENKMEDELSK